MTEDELSALKVQLAGVPLTKEAVINAAAIAEQPLGQQGDSLSPEEITDLHLAGYPKSEPLRVLRRNVALERGGQTMADILNGKTETTLYSAAD